MNRGTGDLVPPSETCRRIETDDRFGGSETPSRFGGGKRRASPARVVPGAEPQPREVAPIAFSDRWMRSR